MLFYLLQSKQKLGTKVCAIYISYINKRESRCSFTSSSRNRSSAQRYVYFYFCSGDRDVYIYIYIRSKRKLGTKVRCLRIVIE